MAYKFKTTTQRSELMKKIKSVDTKPEKKFRSLLRREGIRFKYRCKAFLGKPDLVIPLSKIAIFVDGEFWHGYKWKSKKKTIRSNRKYWLPKIEKNIKRDRKINKELKKIGWLPLRFWHREIMKDPEICIQTVTKLTKKRSSK